jgi:hypothetical protein
MTMFFEVVPTRYAAAEVDFGGGVAVPCRIAPGCR